MVARKGRKSVSTGTRSMEGSASRTAARFLLRGSDLVVIAAGVALAVFLYLGLISFDVSDPRILHRVVQARQTVHVANWGGVVGAETAGAMVEIFGWAAWLLPLFFVVLAVARIQKQRYQAIAWRLIAALALVALSSALIAAGAGSQADKGKNFLPGGLVGQFIGMRFFWQYFSWGTWIFLSVLWVLVFIWSGGLPLARLVWQVLRGLHRRAHMQANRTRVWLIRWRRERAYQKQQEREKNEQEKLAQAGVAATLPEDLPAYSGATPKGERSLPAFAVANRDSEPRPRPFDSVSLNAGALIPERSPKPLDKSATASVFTVVQAASDQPVRPARKQLGLAIKEEGHFTLPAFALLDEHGAETREPDEKNFKAQAQILQGKLKDFGVRGSVEKAHAGPVITVFEFRLAPGTRVSQLTKLEEDLALGMAVQSVRICRFPNRDVMGIEVPAVERLMVPMRAIVEHETFRRKNLALPFALGKSVFGEPIATDITRMPHLLIGGSTGSGKSVAINCLLLSLLFRLRPDELKLFMIDPKRLELAKYEHIPHLGYPVVTEPREAVGMLRMLVRTMTARYDLMAQAGVRNIAGYNKAVRKGEETVPVGARPMPYIVCIVDELADLMILVRKDIEEPIARLAQMARAAGIHLVLATQRPSVDVITGVIKSNFPARIAFKVSARVDSKTILDEIGAQNLLGKGDMLFLDPALGSLTRIHGAFVSDEEVDRVCAFWREQGEPEPMFSAEELAALTEERDSGTPVAAPMEGSMELYEQAVALAIQDQEISISRLQRVLGIGYNRAADLIDRMESEGVIGPPQGAGKRRSVLIRAHHLTPPGEQQDDL